MKPKVFSFRPFISLICVLILWSCSSEKKGLDLVPSTADYVATVNVDVILTSLGIGADGASSTPTHEAEKLLSDYAGLFSSLRRSCDLAHGLSFGDNGKRFLFFDVDNENELQSSLTSTLGLTPIKDKGYEIYPYKDGFINIATRGKQCWIFERGCLISDLESSLRKAEKSNITVYPFLAEYLGKESTFNFAGHSLPGLTGKLKDDNWLTCRVTLNGSELALECSQVDSIGKRIVTKGLTNVSPGFLNYLPSSEGMVGLAAVGIDGLEIDWEKSFAPLISLYGLQARGLLDYLIPFLGQIDGPFAIGVASTDGLDLYNPSPSQVSVAALIHMNPSGIRKALQTIRNQLSWFGNKLTTNPDGSLRLDMGDFEAYACEVDGYLAVSNYPMRRSDALEGLKNIFVGECKGGMYIKIDSMSRLAAGCPDWGITVTGQYRDDILRMTVRLTNTDSPILQSLLQL